MSLNPRGHGRSDVVFALLLVVGSVALLEVHLPAWLQTTAISVVGALSAGLLVATGIKYGTTSTPEERVGAAALDYAVLAVPWCGLGFSVAGAWAGFRWLDLGGSALSIAAGALLLSNARGVSERLAFTNRAVDLVLKPGWLQARALSMHERRAWVRATGMAWIVGSVVDLVVTLG